DVGVLPVPSHSGPSRQRLVHERAGVDVPAVLPTEPLLQRSLERVEFLIKDSMVIWSPGIARHLSVVVNSAGTMTGPVAQANADDGPRAGEHCPRVSGGTDALR